MISQELMLKKRTSAGWQWRRMYNKWIIYERFVNVMLLLTSAQNKATRLKWMINEWKYIAHWTRRTNEIRITTILAKVVRKCQQQTENMVHCTIPFKTEKYLDEQKTQTKSSNQVHPQPTVSLHRLVLKVCDCAFVCINTYQAQCFEWKYPATEKVLYGICWKWN